MYAWRRTNVDDLNRRARDLWAIAGKLGGTYVTAPGGRCYAEGDRIVTLARGDDGRLVTSQRGVVVEVHRQTQTFTARMDDQDHHTFTREEMAADRLTYGYAITVHRSQGDTVDVAHRLEDGGGRELAYVSMSRARQHTTVHVVADNLDQAREDLRHWAKEHRPRWAIDSGTTSTRPLEVETRSGVPDSMRAALRRARLEAERRAIVGALPIPRKSELWAAEEALRRAEQDRRDILTGHGRYAGTEIGRAAWDLRRARQQQHQAEEFARNSGMRWRDRHYWQKSAKSWRDETAMAREAYDRMAGPEVRVLDARIVTLTERRDALQQEADDHGAWMAEHPEAAHRLRFLDDELQALDAPSRPPRPSLAVGLESLRAPGADRQPDHGIDLGL